MPNRINQAMTVEYQGRFGDVPDMIAVDVSGLSVDEVSRFRNDARAKGIEVFVVKNSIARRVLAPNLEENGLDQVISGQTALLYGGEGLPDQARLAHEFGKKSGKLAVRGGVFERKVIGEEEITRFRSIPDRQTLLAQTLSAIVAPMTGLCGAVNELLRAPAALTDALIKKQGGDS